VGPVFLSTLKFLSRVCGGGGECVRIVLCVSVLVCVCVCVGVCEVRSRFLKIDYLLLFLQTVFSPS
jgi:hypothetical protein